MLNYYDTLLVLDLFTETQILMSIILVPQVILEVPAPVVKSAVEFNAEFRALFILEKVTAVLNSVQLSSVSTLVVSMSTTISSMLINAVDVSSLMEHSHLGSTSPSIPYADSPRTSVLMKPSSPRICSSVYSEVYLPEMEYWYKLVIHFSTQDLGEKLFSFVHVFYYNLLSLLTRGGGWGQLVM